MRNATAPCSTRCPKRIIVTAAGRENIVLRALTRQALPMLREPERFSSRERRQLALTLSQALEIPLDLDDDDHTEESEQEIPEKPGYEPGSLLDPWEEASA